MPYTHILLSFCGGVFGTVIGGTFSFFIVGFLTLVGAAIYIATGDQSFINTIALGPFFAPHIAFGGAVAASAYASKVYGTEGKDLLSSDYKTKDLFVLLIGGVFWSFWFFYQGTNCYNCTKH